MKKYLLLTLALVVAGVGIYLAFPPCKESTDEDILHALFSCIQSFDKEAARAQACKEIRGEGPDCVFQEGDEDAVVRFSEDLVAECITNNLKSQNICTDRFEQLFNE